MREFIKKKCLICKREFEINRGKSTRGVRSKPRRPIHAVTCSKKCSAEYNTRKNNYQMEERDFQKWKKWLENECDPPYGYYGEYVTEKNKRKTKKNQGWGRSYGWEK